tara:strand:- start:138 stop:497 length:360 start_codon:yes stop_codon:yes gene_type:complete
MKLLSAISIIATMSVMSFQATASGIYHRAGVDTKTFNGDVAASETQAYANGQKVWQSINSKESYELSKILPSASQKVDARSFEIKNGYIKVKEVMSSDGNINFIPVVKVHYKYKYRPSY